LAAVRLTIRQDDGHPCVARWSGPSWMRACGQAEGEVGPAVGAQARTGHRRSCRTGRVEPWVLSTKRPGPPPRSDAEVPTGGRAWPGAAVAICRRGQPARAHRAAVVHHQGTPRSLGAARTGLAGARCPTVPPGCARSAVPRSTASRSTSAPGVHRAARHLPSPLLAPPAASAKRTHQPTSHFRGPPAATSRSEALARCGMRSSICSTSSAIGVGKYTRGRPGLVRPPGPANSGYCLEFLAGPHLADVSNLDRGQRTWDPRSKCCSNAVDLVLVRPYRGCSLFPGGRLTFRVRLSWNRVGSGGAAKADLPRPPPISPAEVQHPQLAQDLLGRAVGRLVHADAPGQGSHRRAPWWTSGSPMLLSFRGREALRHQDQVDRTRAPRTRLRICGCFAGRPDQVHHGGQQGRVVHPPCDGRRSPPRRCRIGNRGRCGRPGRRWPRRSARLADSVERIHRGDQAKVLCGGDPGRKRGTCSSALRSHQP